MKVYIEYSNEVWGTLFPAGETVFCLHCKAIMLLIPAPAHTDFYKALFLQSLSLAFVSSFLPLFLETLYIILFFSHFPLLQVLTLNKKVLKCGQKRPQLRLVYTRPFQWLPPPLPFLGSCWKPTLLSLLFKSTTLWPSVRRDFATWAISPSKYLISIMTFSVLPKTALWELEGWGRGLLED